MLWRTLQFALVAAVLYFVALSVAGQWVEVRASVAGLRPHAGRLFAASLIVLATYALLIQTWRMVLSAVGEGMGFWTAARIWFVSSFGKYVPGKVWAITAMSVMAGREGVSATAAAGSSIVVQLLNLAAGLAVMVAAGGEALRGDLAWARPIAVTAVTGSVIALALAPFVVRPLASRVARWRGRPTPSGNIPARALWLAVLANVIAWVLYGLAFRVFTSAILGEATGATAGYIAVYTSSYLLGYLAFFAPGGVGVREGALVALMPRFGLASVADALLLAALSRLWLTVLEILPGLLFLARDGLRARPTQTVDDGSS